jgi:hypothetical protein
MSDLLRPIEQISVSLTKTTSIKPAAQTEQTISSSTVTPAAGALRSMEPDLSQAISSLQPTSTVELARI